MKRNASKKAASALLATTLACSLAPTTAFGVAARMSARTAQAGQMAQGSVRAGLAQRLGNIFTPQTSPFASQGMMGQRTLTLGGSMGGTMSFDPTTGDLSFAFGNAGAPMREAQAGSMPQGGQQPVMQDGPAGTGSLALDLGLIAPSDAAPWSGAGSMGGAPTMGGMPFQVGQAYGQAGAGIPGGDQGQVAPDFAGQAGVGTGQPAAPDASGQGYAPGFGGNAGGQGYANAGTTGQPAAPDAGGQGQGYAPGFGGNAGGQATAGSATSASAIVAGTVTNSAADLVIDLDNATHITVSDGSEVKISEAGTYVISGTATDGNIVVKKGVTGVVLVLQDLDLTSCTGATLSVNKGAEAKIVVAGNVTLTDAENAADETSDDAEVADAFDGAAIKVKAGAVAYLTGDGTLAVNGSAKNGIKVTGDEESGYGSLVIDGATIKINATNDGINSNYDLAILSGDLTVSAGDDAIHADRVLTIGDEATHTGPTIDITKSTEGLEGTVVNICGGDVTVNATDDAINAANSDGTFADLGYAINMTGGTVVSNSRADGFDSNGDVNLVAGSATITSASVGGDAGIDYDGQLYVSNEFELNNGSGTAGPDGMGMGGMPAQMGQGDAMGAGMGGQMGQPGMDMGAGMGMGGMR